MISIYFFRIPEYSNTDSNFFVNSPRLLDSILSRNGNSDAGSQNNSSLGKLYRSFFFQKYISLIDTQNCRCSIVWNIKYFSDYFISGVRKKVEDLCGCNDELIRPLDETPDFGSRMKNNSTIQRMEAAHQNLRHQESSGRNVSNQIEQAPKNDLKQKQSHSIWWRPGQPKVQKILVKL